MLNTNNNLQTQTSNAIHNAIIEAGGKDRLPMLAPVDACPNAYEMWKAIESHYTYNSSTRSQQAATKNKGKVIINYSTPTYDQEPAMVTDDDKITSSNTSRANQDNTLRINKGTGYDNQRTINVAGARENVDAEMGKGCSLSQGKNAIIQEVTLDAADNSRHIFDVEALQKVQNDNDNYNVFANKREYPEQPESVNDTYLDEQDEHNIIINSLDVSLDREQDDQDDDDLAKERDLLSSLIEKLKCEINDNKDRNKILESSNKTLVDKLEGEIKNFETKNKSLESSNNDFKEANNELSKTNQLMFKDLKKFQAELDRYHDVNYASKVETDYAKDKDTIFIMLQEKEAQKKFHKTHEDKELEKVIALENKIKFLDDIVYETGQSVQIMNMLNRNCKTSFVKLEFHVKDQRAIHRLYDIARRDNFISVHSRCSKHMTGNLNLLSNFVEQVLGTMMFRNDKIAPILRYGKNLDNMKEKSDACIFVGYSTQSRSYRVYKKRTRVIAKTIHVNFDEMPHMAPDHVSSDLVPQCLTIALEQDNLSLDPQSQEHIPQAAEIVTMSNELDFLCSMMFDKVLNGTTQVESKSSVVTTTDAPNQHQQQHTTPSTLTTVVADTPLLNIQTIPETTSQAPTQAPTVTPNENII
uniref:Retroviral polymerase SH3-like domain-containing protein n=1 Tax=Tanacetum cinerariifolium TaxID=118510 RepID=A0A6L2LJC9_TANCI|nr:hypothetical protein [Tanacetum cinerariifolium]